MPEMKSQTQSSTANAIPPFVSREQELRALHEALQAALAGAGQIRFISGEAGSGKTALITEFAHRAQQQHTEVVVAMGVCNAQIGLGDPYLPFREILGLLSGDMEGKLAKRALTQENARRLKKLKNISLHVLTELGPDLAGAFLPGLGMLVKAGAVVADKAGWLEDDKKDSPAKLLEELDENRLVEQYTVVLRKLAAAHPLLLVLDDVQWTDVASASLLFYLTRQLRESRLLILGLYRPAEVLLERAGQRHPLQKILAETKRYYGDVILDLDHAGAREGRSFVNAFLDTEANRLGENFRTALFQRTGGHPLFTVELLRFMQEQGDLVQDGSGAWVENAHIDWNRFPSRVEGVIEERVGRLETPLKAMLAVASVEGAEFTAQVIAGLENLKEREVLRQLCQELDARHRLIHEQAELEVGPHILARFRFAHALFQEHFYHQHLRSAERRVLHRDMGLFLEELYGERTDTIILQLARHFEEARLWDKAVAYRLRAGEQARQLYACEPAIAHLEKALELLDKLPTPAPAQRLRACSALGELLTITGKHSYAREHLAAALKLAGDMGNPSAMAHCCRWLARGYENEGVYPSALEWIERGLAALAGQGTAETVQLHLLAGLVQLRRGEFEAALKHAQLALRVAQTLKDQPTLANTYVLLAVIALQRGQNQRSMELAQRGLEHYTQAGDLAGQASAHNQIANARFNIGQWTQAAQSYHEARESFRRIGDVYNRAIAENNLGEIALNQGRLEEAFHCYREALHLLEQAGGSEYILGILHNNLGAVLIERRAFRAAQDQLHSAQQCFAQTGARDILPELHRHWATLALRQGNLAEAQTHAQHSLKLARELVAHNEEGITLRVVGEIALARQDAQTAAESLAQSLGLLQPLDETFQIARVRLTRARLFLALSQPADARAELDACEPVFAHLEAMPDLAAARELQGEI